uniref:Uncharacterized protein n=1 Tax=viral metagenome TaxID=1070528 RepID=A0A6C0BIW5_9ZZZZ
MRGTETTTASLSFIQLIDHMETDRSQIRSTDLKQFGAWCDDFRRVANIIHHDSYSQ